MSEPAKEVKGEFRFIGPEAHSLDAIFKPRNVALIGASETKGSVGRTILWNLISSPFGGTVFPINPKRPSVLGIKAYPKLDAVPEPVDLAVIATPASSIPGIIQQCADAGVKGVIIISAGFKELGPPGEELEHQVMKIASEHGIRIIGPNCLGAMNPLTGLNATFAGTMARPGNIAFISQSGALCTAVLDWARTTNIGFSAFVSIGSMLDVNWGDLIWYFGNDPRTQAIVIYMETIGNARAFLTAAREVALNQPIIVIKPGRTAAAAQAAASHTGSLTGSDEVLDAAFRRCGVLRVQEIAELFHMADTLSKQPRPKGNRLTIVTNAGGPGVLATDKLIVEGGELAKISDSSMKIYNELLPEAWSRNNPIDILGDAQPERYARTIATAAKDPNSDGMLVILTPQDMTDPTQIAEQLRPYAKSEDKPILASWMGGAGVEAGRSILMQAGIPAFRYPDAAANIFNYMWQYSSHIQALYETPHEPTHLLQRPDRVAEANKIIQEVRAKGRSLLTEYESKRLLAAYGFPTVQTKIATTAEEAVKAAEEIGYPVVLKLHSETITHKTDVGGVKLNLEDEAAVKSAFESIRDSVTQKAKAEDFLGVTVQPMEKIEGYEIIIGSSIDPQFGPVLLFGSGGQLVEVYKDRALGLPPLTTTLARLIMERTKIFTALKGVRGRKPVDIATLEQIMVSFSYLVVENPWIKEIDINPLIASPERIIALDARVLLHDPEIEEKNLPKPAIRPYPSQYVWEETLEDGDKILIRPIMASDEPLVAKYHENLSERTVYLRFLHMINLSARVAHERLLRICFNDYSREIALVAEHKNEETGENEIVGIVRLTRVGEHNYVEYVILITDNWQNRGLGTLLLKKLIETARAEGVRNIIGIIHPQNMLMRKVCEKVGFRLRYDEDEELIRAQYNIQ
ncbi:acetate--CoA ligase family protein [Candidatus Sumerlaeota bacterium]|nr:acetate--CoA ligase family protein [Candidatus Sumerlaeota bacterium]